jgi:arylsulfatase A-like enzyme
MRTTSLVFGLAALLAPAIAAADTTDPTKPNIILILLDDVSVDKIGSYAGDFPTYAPLYRPATPTIDALASSGLRFKRAWATPYCSSTRVSIQTGLHPFRTGVGTAYGENVAGFDPTTLVTPTLAGSFTSNNYATGMFGKWHLGTADATYPAAGSTGWPGSAAGPVTFFDAPHPARMGWQRFFGHLGGYPGPDALDPDDGYFRWQRVGWVGATSTGYADYEDDPTVHMTDRTVEVASSWINTRTEPFLAFVALNAGHAGRTASGPWNILDVDTSKYRTAALSCLGAGTCSTNERIFQGLVEHADIAIEDLLNSMDPDTLDNTLIFVMGDNGTPYQVSEDDFHTSSSRGKGSTWENGVRVPLIVAEGSAWRTGVAGTRIPDINRVIDAKVHLLDVYNTLHNVAFMVSMANVDSVGFADCFTNNDIYCNRPVGRYGYAETFPLSGVANSSTQASVSFQHDTMKLCYMPSTTAGAPATGCLKEHFYDVSTDPLQTNPLAWPGIRAQRLRDYFTTLHTGTGSWAEPAGVVLPFCGAAVATNCPGF